MLSATDENAFLEQSGEFTQASETNVASTFRGRTTAKSVEELKRARETRAMEALKMKDEQLKILSDQNASLLASLDKLEDEANVIQMEKLAIEQENRSIRDSNFELQSKARAAETLSKRVAAESADKEQQLRVMTDQNSELLRLLESEEGLTAQLQGEVSEVRAELDEIRQKYGALLMTAKAHEELATKAAREGQLRAEEIRLLRAETEQLKQVNGELKMKTQVEAEALQEQLRVRKEKQYQLLEKLQSQEEAKRQAEDQVVGMEEQLRGIHARNVELETQIQVVEREKQNLEDANKVVRGENETLFNQSKDLQLKIEKGDKERLRLEAEGRDSSEQLREMAEKVFQLLERLKLAELGKTKAMEALKKKEQDMIALQKKNARLIKEATEEGRAKVKAELDVKVLQEQVRTLKKNNQTLALKSKDEATEKVDAWDQVEKLKESLHTTESRLSFLLNKVQADEEAKVIQIEDRKKLEAQVSSFNEKCEELQHKLTEMGESNRVITQALRLKQEELNTALVKFDALSKEIEMRDVLDPTDGAEEAPENLAGPRPGAPDDPDNVRLNHGRGRFSLEAKSLAGGTLLVIKARKPLYKDWLRKHNINEFLRQAQRNARVREMIIEKLSMVLGLLMVEEEEKTKLATDVQTRTTQLDLFQKKIEVLQDSLGLEEDAKRRMLLRYIHAVKENALSSNGGSASALQLPESSISDEEVHALAALLRNNANIQELNLRGNNITDDGARALGAVLAGRTALRHVDLRGNKIGPAAIKFLTEALERSERVRHVYVHAGGKIEALGAREGGEARESLERSGSLSGGGPEVVDPRLAVTVGTVCVVDVRDNNPEAATASYTLLALQDPNRTTGLGDGNAAPKMNTAFTPTVLLDNSGMPPSSNLMSEDAKKKAKKGAGKKKKISRLSEEELNAIAEAEKKKMRIKARQEIAQSVREASWQGRAAGYDRTPAPDSSYDFDLNAGGSFFAAEKVVGRNPHRQLPPLIGFTGDASSGAGAGAAHGSGGAGMERTRSAPNSLTVDSSESDAFRISSEVEGAISKAKSKTNVVAKVSDMVKRLQNSPFAQPVLVERKQSPLRR